MPYSGSSQFNFVFLWPPKYLMSTTFPISSATDYVEGPLQFSSFSLAGCHHTSPFELCGLLLWKQHFTSQFFSVYHFFFFCTRQCFALKVSHWLWNEALNRVDCIFCFPSKQISSSSISFHWAKYRSVWIHVLSGWCFTIFMALFNNSLWQGK